MSAIWKVSEQIHDRSECKFVDAVRHIDLQSDYDGFRVLSDPKRLQNKQP